MLPASTLCAGLHQSSWPLLPRDCELPIFLSVADQLTPEFLRSCMLYSLETASSTWVLILLEFSFPIVNNELPSKDPLAQRPPTLGPRTSTGPCPVRNWATEQEVSGGRASEASSVFTAAPHRSHYCLSSASYQHYGELYNYFIIYYNVIITEMKCTINVMHLNHPETIPPNPGPRKNCLPRNQSLVLKRLGTAALA